MSFLGEIKRRKVFQVAAVYAVMAWLIIQIVDVIGEPLSLPDWLDTVVIILLAVGFPIAVILAWAFDLTPQGIKAASDVQDVPSQAGSQRFGYISQALILLAVGFLVLDQYVLEPEVGVTQAVSSDQPSSAPARRYRVNLVSTETTGNTGLSAHLAISPDGKHLVYAAQVGGVSHLYLRTLSQLESVQLPGTQGAEHPFFSPDGESVGFFSDTFDQKLKVASIQSGLPLAIADTPLAAGASWSTGNSIVFSTQDASGDRSLFRVPATGGAPEVVVSSDAEAGYVWPKVLPGGEAILFSTRPSGDATSQGRIEVLSQNTGERRVLVDGGYNARYVPTGHLVFVRAASLWAVPFDLARLETTGREALVVSDVQTDGLRGATAYAISDDGLLVYEQGSKTLAGGNKFLVWVDREGNEELISTEPREYEGLDLSPDDNFIAFTVAEPNNVDIHIHDLSRSDSRRFTFDPANDRFPLWTPDGQRIVFLSEREGNSLFWKAADGTGQVERLITGVAGYQGPESFSPDGNQLVYFVERAQTDLHLLTMGETPTSQPFLTETIDEDMAAISPDGRWVAYQSSETAVQDIFVGPFPNVAESKWQVSQGGGGQPVWGPDGRELFYTTNEGIMAVAVETEPLFRSGTPELLFPWSFPAGQQVFDVSSNGERFLLLKYVQPASDLRQVVVVDNWFEELSRLAPPSE